MGRRMMAWRLKISTDREESHEATKLEERKLATLGKSDSEGQGAEKTGRGG